MEMITLSTVLALALYVVLIVAFAGGVLVGFWIRPKPWVT